MLSSIPIPSDGEHIGPLTASFLYYLPVSQCCIRMCQGERKILGKKWLKKLNMKKEIKNEICEHANVHVLNSKFTLILV